MDFKIIYQNGSKKSRILFSKICFESILVSNTIQNKPELFVLVT